MELNTNINPKSGRYLGYELSLEKLDPHPKADEQLKPSQYEATLILEDKTVRALVGHLSAPNSNLAIRCDLNNRKATVCKS